MRHLGWAICVLAVVLSGCVRTSTGVPVAGDGPAATTQSGPGAYGVVPTTRAPVPAGTVTCMPPPRPGDTYTAVVADPHAPQITVIIPELWTASAGSGDVGAQLSGPDGMSATVTIAPTELDPAAAFTEYSDQLLDDVAVSSVSVVPGQLCDYSGQKLIGAWSDVPENAVEFGDRIAHIWTDHGDYLIAVHVEAPTGTAGFDAAYSTLTRDFEVRLP